MHYYEVALTKIIRSANPTFTYSSQEELAIGVFVDVPVGARSQLGVIVKEVEKPTYEVKPVTSALPQPPLPAELVATALWMSDYYATHLAVVLQTILPRGLTKTRRVKKTIAHQQHRDRTHFLLNTEQSRAVETISQVSSGTTLLHGVTGSGKTAVYIELAKRSLSNNRSVIILVPEIALTSQLVSEFMHHFEHIIVSHSQQTEAERHVIWEQLLTSQKPQVVIGPRSALFSPLRSIGLIVIDESHEPSFKQEQSPRYFTPRVASILAREHSARVVQGSATPLVSEYYFATQANRPIARLHHPAIAQIKPPHVDLIDMTKRSQFLKHRFFSDILLDRIQQTLSDNQQTLIFHNRRGSASTTLCEHCGWMAMCTRCIVPMTLHADQHLLRCHICNITLPVPTSCPECRSTDILHKGIGTKLIESELRRLFPHATIARFDGDVATNETVEKRYKDLYDGTIDIIIGTQVIAKGLDLPKLQSVGVIQADAGLMLPDFTSSERTFQLLAQVVGRVGRNHLETSVVVQSYQPTHPAIQFAIKQDYDSFYDHTLAERRAGQFPPFTYLLKFTCTYKTESAAIRAATTFANVLKRDAPHLSILGPAPCFYEHTGNTYRWQIIVKSSSRSELLRLSSLIPSAHWRVDVDPASLL